ncbi:class I SAM-dependent DNA methyltransferase [Roseospira navarrensis]|uniref:site-specific DNA-methyltransferase (adenine-specific) n=1 Tax=Roseospira navarrensis TaxID=140058 RepID=A0A7X1ZEL4_9PROT|nr:class I SAM-dependent DNA methyltransferase [Roseospira navarrensis]MQX36873.1 class I SAM-dependent DNA methyltransferase [Roseospira navarrensis]
MTPESFIAKWQAAELKERSAAQEHFIDLCRMLGEQTPAEADPKGEWYCFERGATKTTGGEGWADVWKRGHFGWEYKGKRKDLSAAFVQLQQYAVALENPPLLIVCDLDDFEIHTNWTNTVSEVHRFTLDDLTRADVRDKLKWAMSEPDRLKPTRTRDSLTADVASDFAALAASLRTRFADQPQAVAHFINRMIFCMFAEDVDLLPNDMFSRLLDRAFHAPEDFPDLVRELFARMAAGGFFGVDRIAWFNGGLFDADDTVFPLTRAEIDICRKAAAMEWGDIDPSIFGTLFERGLDPDKRSQLGAHYTDRDKIMLIVEPVILRPLLAEWTDAKAAIAEAMAKAENPKSTPATRTRHRNRAETLRQHFMERLRGFRALDPACGSGNFLYVALHALKDLELRVNLECEALGLQKEFPSLGPEVVKGIEINPYAAELARVTVWIGEIQWMKRRGFDVSRNPILKPLDTIECRDAVLTEAGKEAPWPKADVVIGNPPFLGGKRMRDGLGDDYVNRLFRAYDDRVPAEADLVAYWFAKAWQAIQAGTLTRAGLVSTNSIRGGASRRVLTPIVEQGAIYEAWDDEPWVVEGAAVRVAMVCFAAAPPLGESRLDGVPVDRIYSDLTSGGVDLTKAQRLPENKGVAFMGDTKGGAFDVSGDVARAWLKQPLNPNGRPNADVLMPWVNGMDLTRRPAGKWIIDFGWDMSEADCALYEEPFLYSQEKIKPDREKRQSRGYAKAWWRHERPRPEMWDALKGNGAYIATPTVAKYRLFVRLPRTVCPDHQLIVIARDDDTAFGILHSRFHETWALRLGTWLGKGNDPRYTPSTTFETFPFPEGLTPDIPAADYAGDPRAIAIAEAARNLDELRRNWLNPADLVEVVPEVVPGYPDRLIPKDDEAAAVLKKRTLTNLYNQRPAWLANAHEALDQAVADAYGWPADISDDDALARLFALNQDRAAAEGA